MKRIVVGIHSVEECLKLRANDVEILWIHKNFKNSQELKSIFDLASRYSIKIKTSSPEFLDELCSGHQGVALRCSSSPSIDWQAISSKENSIIIALDSIEDPHNYGALIRTAWLLGVDGVISPKDRSSGVDKATVNKVASGGAEHLGVESVTNLSRTLEDLKGKDFWVYGLAEEGTEDLWQCQFSGKIVWVIGNESRGIRPGIKKNCDVLVNIFQVGSGSSYNASVAGAIAMAETRRQMKC